MFRISGINCVWIVNNFLQVLSHLSTINNGSKSKYLDVFDFAIVYTNIPHDSLKCNINLLINEAFNVQGSQFLSLNWQGLAYWSVNIIY